MQTQQKCNKKLPQKRKLSQQQNESKKVRKSTRSNNKPKQTYIDTISDSDDELYVPSPSKVIKTKTKQSKSKSIAQLLSAQNAKMKKCQKKINGLCTNWLKHNYRAFEPFLSDRVRRRLRPKQNASDLNIISSVDYVEQPELLKGGTLRDYQLKSVNWLRSLRNNGVPAILADEMGLGMSSAHTITQI